MRSSIFDFWIQEYWPGENNEIGQVHEDNTKRPIWLQLRKGDLTLSRKGIKEDSLNDVSIYGSADDCEGEILVWFEVISVSILSEGACIA